MEYKEKLKIKPWLLPLEEVERMPGVTLEDLRKARYGDSLYPITWYEQIEDTPEGWRHLSLVYHRNVKRILQATIERAELLRGISQTLKGQHGLSTRAYQHAAFWLFASTKNFKYWVRRQNSRACKEGWAKVKREGVYFDFEAPKIKRRAQRKLIYPTRNSTSGKTII